MVSHIAQFVHDRLSDLTTQPRWTSRRVVVGLAAMIIVVLMARNWALLFSMTTTLVPR